MFILIAAINGIPLPEPSPYVMASPGDILMAEIYARWWSHGVPHVPGELDTLRGFQATVDFSSYFSGTSGNILPVAFHETTDPDHLCPLHPGPSAQPNIDHAFVDTNHPNWVYEGLVSFPVINSRTCNYVYGAATTATSPTPANLWGIHPPAYFGTLMLEASSDAGGVFELCLSDLDNQCIPYGPDASRLVPRTDPQNASARILPLKFECATVVVFDGPLPGCGECRLHGDVAELSAAACVIDVDDLLCMLDGFSNMALCPRADIVPCSPDACVSDGDCASSQTGLVCINGACRCLTHADCAAMGALCNAGRQGGRCEVVDVDDLLSELDAFAGAYACQPPCPPGACVGEFTDDGLGVTCRDGNVSGGFFMLNGMAETDCFLLTNGTGTYCGDNTICDPDATCPGSP